MVIVIANPFHNYSSQNLSHYLIAGPYRHRSYDRGIDRPGVQFGHYCDCKLQCFYWSVATAEALLCALSTFHPISRSPEGRKSRGFPYNLLGLSSFFPAIYGMVENDSISWVESLSDGSTGDVRCVVARHRSGKGFRILAWIEPRWAGRLQASAIH